MNTATLYLINSSYFIKNIIIIIILPRKLTVDYYFDALCPNEPIRENDSEIPAHVWMKLLLLSVGDTSVVHTC